MSQFSIPAIDGNNPNHLHQLDLIIQAQHIESIEALRALVSLITDTIHCLISQMHATGLSERGARIKILHCLQLIQHTQIGNHPMINRAFDRLIQQFEHTYKACFEQPFRLNQPCILSNASIQSKLDIILDHPCDPIYLDTPIDNSWPATYRRDRRISHAITPPALASQQPTTSMSPFFHYAPFFIEWLLPQPMASIKPQPLPKKPLFSTTSSYHIMPHHRLSKPKEGTKGHIDLRA